MIINRYGLPMHGLRKAAGATSEERRGAYTQVLYDRGTGEIWTRWHPSVNSWTQYDDTNIITVCKASRHITMQELADDIADAVALRDYYDKIPYNQ